MNKLIIAFTVILTASSAQAQSRRSLKDIDRELKQTKSTATAMALIESIGETIPQTDDDVAALGQLMDKYPAQGQRALSRIKDPKFVKAIMKECDRQAQKVKGDKDIDWKALPADQRQEKIVSLLNTHAIVAVLGNLKNKDALPLLKKYITPEYDGVLSYEASQAIGKIAPDDPAVFNELWSKNDVKSISYNAYGKSLLKEVAQKMQDPKMAKTEKNKLLSKANVSLLSGKDPEEKKLIKDIVLNHPDRWLREDAGIAMLHALSNKRDPEDLEFVLNWTKNPKDPASGWAMYYMRDSFSPKFTPRLIKYLKESDYGSTRANAAEALGQNQIKEAVPYLEEALMDNDSGVRGSALMALVNILGKDYRPKYAYPGDSDKKLRRIKVQPRANK